MEKLTLPESPSMTNQTKSIAISGLNRGENPQPGAAVIASIRRIYPEFRIVGLSYDPLESSLYSKEFDHSDVAYLLPFPGTGSNALLERLEIIIKKENVGYIIPCLDLEIQNYIGISKQLETLGVKCILPSLHTLENMSKLHLYDFCQGINVASPITKVATDLFSLQTLAEAMKFPVYVKGQFYDAKLTYTAEALVEAGRKISRVWGWPLIVQEAISGEEYNIVGLGNGEGGIIQTCTIRKFQRSIAGKGFAGIVVENSELDRLAQHIIKELQWNGPFELEFIKSPCGPYALFEINPRFPAWVDFPSQLECNLPVRHLENLIGTIDKTPLRTCAAGQMFVRHCIDLVGDISELADMASAGVRNITPYRSLIEVTK